MKKSNKYLSILFLSCTIIAPFLLWINYFAYPNSIEATTIGEFISWSIYSIFFSLSLFLCLPNNFKNTEKNKEIKF